MALTPMTRPSLALDLSSSLYPSVSLGSTSLRRNFLPLSTLKGSANSRALLITSFVFMNALRSFVGQKGSRPWQWQRAKDHTPGCGVAVQKPCRCLENFFRFAYCHHSRKNSELSPGVALLKPRTALSLAPGGKSRDYTPKPCLTPRHGP